jgi:hypothetical protein
MEPLIYVLAIMGCADGGELCEPVAHAPVRFESRAECLAYVQANLPNYTDLPYPVIAGRCDAQGVQMAARTSPHG